MISTDCSVFFLSSVVIGIDVSSFDGNIPRFSLVGSADGFHCDFPLFIGRSFLILSLALALGFPVANWGELIFVASLVKA